MGRHKKLMIIITIVIILSLIFILRKPEIQAGSYDKDGNLLDDIKYETEDMNVILIVFNTLRAQNVGVYGYERDTTPNIDAYSKEGVLFKQAYAPWTKTGPALVSILTGQYPHTTGIMRQSSQVFPESLTSISEILKQNGYVTLGIASNPNTGEAFNFNQGFDEFIDVVPDGSWLGDNSKHTVDETNEAIDLITKYKDEKFFLYLHYLDPHGPYTPPAPFNVKYVEDEYFYKYNKHLPVTNNGLLGVIPKYLEVIPKYPSVNISQVDNIVSQYDREVNSVDYIVSQYDGEVNYVDYQVGVLLNKIKELNLDENSLIILMSDHGSSLGEHDYWFEHGAFAYDATAQVLLTMSYPKLLPKNKIIDEPLNTVNVVPTILDILNIPISKEMEGKSLMPLISKNEIVDEYVYGEGGYNEEYITTIRNKKWKFIKNGNYVASPTTNELRGHTMAVWKIVAIGTNTFDAEQVSWPIYELYDIENDPDETTNLFDQEPEIAEELMTQLYKWLNKPKAVSVNQIIKKPQTLDEETTKRLQALGYLN